MKKRSNQKKNKENNNRKRPILILKGRKEIMMEEKIKALALNEFGTLEGVTISYYVDVETGRVHYCFTRK